MRMREAEPERRPMSARDLVADFAELASITPAEIRRYSGERA